MGDEKIAKTYRIRPYVAKLIEQAAKIRKVPAGDVVEEMVLAWKSAANTNG